MPLSFSRLLCNAFPDAELRYTLYVCIEAQAENSEMRPLFDVPAMASKYISTRAPCRFQMLAYVLFFFLFSFHFRLTLEGAFGGKHEREREREVV